MNKSTSWMIWYAIILHFVWGMCLLFSDRPTWITAINELTRYVENHVFLGIIMISVAYMSAISLLESKVSIKGLLLLIPQQLVLMMSMFGAIKGIINSSFADGVVRPRVFIFCDQFPAILGTIMHTIAILSHYGRGTWKQLR